MSIHRFLLIASALTVLGIALGCERANQPKKATQVAAKVNGAEITVHQINNVLATRTNISPEVLTQVKRAILEGLIDQELRRQLAIESQLDRSPKIIQAVEAARTEILARAYLDGQLRTLPQPLPWEVEKYYKEHPELFAQRRIFSLEEISLIATDDIISKLRKQLLAARSIQDIADWVQSQPLKFNLIRGIRAAEQIPLALLPKVQAMKEGQTELFEGSDGRFQIIRVVGFLEAPLDLPAATPRIQRFLFNQRSAQAITREICEIRARSKIEYLGEFSGGTASREAPVDRDVDVEPRPDRLPEKQN